MNRLMFRLMAIIPRLIDASAAMYPRGVEGAS
jgi:hypothetical protein